MRYRMVQLNKKESPDEQIKAAIARHIQKYGPPPFVVEVNPSVAPQLTPCQDVSFVLFQHVQRDLIYIQVREKEEIA